MPEIVLLMSPGKKYQQKRPSSQQAKDLATKDALVNNADKFGGFNISIYYIVSHIF